MTFRGNIMHKIFSVEWLSRSYHAQQLDQQKAAVDTVSSRDPPAALHSDSFRNVPKVSPNARDLDGEAVNEEFLSSPENSRTSASESDVGDDGETDSGPHRRVRTKFTCEQISRLEQTFNKHRYLGTTQRRRTAERLHLSETQVKTWFQNRRMKLKREVLDMRTAECLLRPALTSFQHHGQRHYQQPLRPFAPRYRHTQHLY